MATRHLLRTTVFQTFFEWDFYKRKKDFVDILERNVNKLSSDVYIDEPEFAWKIAQGMIDNLEEIDETLKKAAPEWPIEHITLVDRNILRLGIYELLYADKEEVPAKVAINEAIELAKNYGGINSSRFVNGVLGTIYRQLQDDGKLPKEESEKDKKTPVDKDDDSKKTKEDDRSE